jgi:small conductance mechanosensitive channel
MDEQLEALADSSVNLDVRPWVAVADHGAAGGELNRSILERFRRQDISIPFPQREVRVLGSRS